VADRSSCVSLAGHEHRFHRQGVTPVADPASVLGVDRNYTGFGIVSGWALSNMGTFTHVPSTTNGTLNSQISGEGGVTTLLCYLFNEEPSGGI